uniref:Methyltransferase FkbM domain-containing protein n=1 Tax=Sexangularia sp. CB-2014 TaxID=1486929 RepID=A0A7S1YIQ8_9EUKA
MASVSLARQRDDQAADTGTLLAAVLPKEDPFNSGALAVWGHMSPRTTAAAVHALTCPSPAAVGASLAICFDVGANIGFFSLVALHAGRCDAVVSVEVEPRLVRRLAISRRLSHAPHRWHLVHAAASNTSDSLDSREAWSRRREVRPSLLGLTRVRPREVAPPSWPPVPGVTVDDLAARLAQRVGTANVYVPLLKVDVEGGDGEVLQGARSLLHRCAVGSLLVELTDESAPVLLDLLAVAATRCGYRAYAFREDYLATTIPPSLGSLLADGVLHPLPLDGRTMPRDAESVYCTMHAIS